MSGIFGESLFGVGQADMTFTEEEVYGSGGGKVPNVTAAPAGGAAYLPPAPVSSAKPGAAPSASAYAPSMPNYGSMYPTASPSTYLPAQPTSSTTVYLVAGGVAIVGLVAAAMLMGGNRRVAANRKRRRKR